MKFRTTKKRAKRFIAEACALKTRDVQFRGCKSPEGMEHLENLARSVKPVRFSREKGTE